MSFNACNSSEFNCNDGNCVAMEERCDGRIDCTDKSDEIGCEMITVDDSYLKNIPAPPEVNDEAAEVAGVGGDLTNITISVDVISILDIMEVDSLLSLQLRVSLG